MNMTTDPYASVVILTRNGLPLLKSCLNAVLAQQTAWPFEVILIDSESTDGTWELIQSQPVRAKQIQASDFNHGRTRNLGGSLAQGQFLVFLVQDAVPTDNHWLQCLVTAVEPEGIAGSYGREKPWPSDHALVRLHMEQTLTQSPELIYQSLPKDCSWHDLSPWEKFRLATFHDTCSCLKKTVWQQYPYHALQYGEDLEWAARVIEAGYTIVYQPEAAVYHSHDRSSWYEMKRAYADHELVMRLFDLQMFPRLGGVVASWLSSSWRFIKGVHQDSGPIAQRVSLMLRAPIISGARHWGSYLGARAARKNTLGFLWRYVDNTMRRGV
jgi:rhamnosyltransferase